MLVQTVRKVCILSDSRMSRDLHKDVKDLGGWNSEVDEGCWEQHTGSKNSALLLRATAFCCRDLQRVARGSLRGGRAGCAGGLAEVEAHPFPITILLGGGLSLLWLKGWSFRSWLVELFFLPWSEHSLPSSLCWLLAQPLRLRKAVRALRCYLSTRFSWHKALLWKLVTLGAFAPLGFGLCLSLPSIWRGSFCFTRVLGRQKWW